MGGICSTLGEKLLEFFCKNMKEVSVDLWLSSGI
jgi:hypothetical protein